MSTSEEEVGQLRSVDEEDNDIPLGRSVGEGDEVAAGNNDDSEPEITGRSWNDDLPEGRVAEEDEEEV